VTSNNAQAGRCPEAHVEQRRASGRRSGAGVQAGRAVPGLRRSGGPDMGGVGQRQNQRQAAVQGPGRVEVQARRIWSRGVCGRGREERKKKRIETAM